MNVQVIRKACGRGFSYVTKTGKTIGDRDMREWINALAIPPAWRNVVINTDKREKIWAVGRDKSGKKQYIYNAQWRKRRDKRKFGRLVAFCNALDKARGVVESHLAIDEYTREKVLASMVTILDAHHLRPGSIQYARKNKSFGLTTLRSKHLSIDGDDIVFKFTGKSGVDQKVRISNPRICELVLELDALPGRNIFKYFDDDGNRVDVSRDELNGYIRNIMKGDYSAKDFRTWSGTLLCAAYLDRHGKSKHKTSRDKKIVKAVKYTAKKLGNTPAIARVSYIDPRVLDAYNANVLLTDYERQAKRNRAETRLGFEERCLRSLLIDRDK